MEAVPVAAAAAISMAEAFSLSRPTSLLSALPPRRVGCRDGPPLQLTTRVRALSKVNQSASRKDVLPLNKNRHGPRHAGENERDAHLKKVWEAEGPNIRSLASNLWRKLAN